MQSGAVVQGNTAGNFLSGASGGGIFNYEGTVNVDQAGINGNSASINGGGIFNNDGTVDVRNASTINDNQVGGDGGGIYNSGDGIVIIDTATLNSNSALTDGGGIYSFNGDVTLQNVSMTSNSADYDGGGIYSRGGPNNILLVTNSVFSDNTAGGNGGAIAHYAGGDITLRNTTVAQNTAPTGGVFHSSRLTPTTRSTPR